MIRIEYTVDGKNWNMPSREFEDEDSAVNYLKECGFNTFCKSARLLVVTSVIPVEFKNDS